MVEAPAEFVEVADFQVLKRVFILNRTVESHRTSGLLLNMSQKGLISAAFASLESCSKRKWETMMKDLRQSFRISEAEALLCHLFIIRVQKKCYLVCLASLVLDSSCSCLCLT